MGGEGYAPFDRDAASDSALLSAQVRSKANRATSETPRRRPRAINELLSTRPMAFIE